MQKWVTINDAALQLRAGRVVAFPTETTYGIGALARDPAAIRALVAVRGRDAGKPLIVLVRSLQEARLVARDIPLAASTLASAFWPGPLTIVLPAREGLPAEVTAGTGTVSVRIPGSAVTRRLIALAGGPIVAPSANPPGAQPARSAQAARVYFPGVFALDGGTLPQGAMSTVVALDPLRVLREGRISKGAIERALGIAQH